MSTSAKRPTPASARTAPPAVVQITLGVILAIIVAMVACTQVAPSTDAPAGPAPAEVLPAGFPIPDGAQLMTDGIGDPGAGVVTLSVEGSVADVVAFYGEQLPSAGWTTEPWEGTDPFGDQTSGLILRKEGDEGALAVTAADDGRSTVQINLNQPVSPSEPSHSMGGGS